MEAMLGFEGEEEICSSSCYKLVPWLSWGEWEDVRKSIFSSSPDKIAFALKRVSTWRSRGCLPVVIDITASIVEIQQKDPVFRNEGGNDDFQSEQILAMLYCMATLRLVNCVVEKTRKQHEISIADAADEIGIPRILIDVRHEGSHRDLPSLTLVRDSSIMALNWLKSYYWEPQRKQIPFQKNDSSNIRNEIKSKLSELAYDLKVKQSPDDQSLLLKGKRGRQTVHHIGRNKLFSAMANRAHSPKLGGSKKQITKTLKTIASLYSSFSSEVISVLLELLLKVLDDYPKDSQAIQDSNSLLDDWRPVVKKLSSKEPDLILALLQRVLDTIEIKEDVEYGIGDVSALENRSQSSPENLSYLFAWLVQHLKEVNPLKSKKCTTKGLSHAVLMELLKKSLLVSASSNSHLVHSAIQLVQLLGDESLIKKLEKLCSFSLSSSDVSKDSSLSLSSENLNQQEESISRASKKLELIKLNRMKSKSVETSNNVGKRWVVAKSWNPCPIGMLPRVLGSSGRLPILDCNDHPELLPSSKEKKNWEPNQCSSKRRVSPEILEFDDSSSKKARVIKEANRKSDSNDLSSPGVGGRLLINTVWKHVALEEIHAAKSSSDLVKRSPASDLKGTLKYTKRVT